MLKDSFSYGRNLIYVREPECENLELHFLRPYPLSCPNRGENGLPKTAMFGGNYRGRISSQCKFQKVRSNMIARMPDVDLGVRTDVKLSLEKDLLKDLLKDVEQANKKSAKLVCDLVFEAISLKGKGKQRQDAAKLKKKENQTAKKSEKEKSSETSTENEKPEKNNEVDEKQKRNAWLVSKVGYQNLLDLVKDNFDKIVANKKIESDLTQNLIKQLYQPSLADIFGKMLSNCPEGSINIRSVFQNAHLITVNSIMSQQDYFAVVDEKDKDTSGALHIGNRSLYDGIHYEYHNCNLTDVKRIIQREVENNKLHEDQKHQLLLEFLATWAASCFMAVPEGMQTSCAQNAFRPKFSAALYRKSGMPSCMMSAFMNPISNDYVNQSVNRLVQCWNDDARMYGENGLESAFYAAPGIDLEIEPTGWKRLDCFVSFDGESEGDNVIDATMRMIDFA